MYKTEFSDELQCLIIILYDVFYLYEEIAWMFVTEFLLNLVRAFSRLKFGQGSL